MKEQFELQPIEHAGGGRSVMAWNLPLWELGADPKRPLRVEATWPLLEPDPTGMPEAPEAKDLEDLYPGLAGLMKRKAGAKYALRVTGKGVETHVFYVAPRVGVVRKRDVREIVEPALKRFGDAKGRPVEVAFEDDPGWTRLLGIFSAHDPARWHADRDLLIHMVKQRDAVAVKREVAHRAHFDEREQCREFLQAARKVRFKSEGGPKKAAPGAPGAWTGVVVRREPTLATWHLHPVVLEVKAMAVGAGGEYDGWEAELVARKDPEPLAPPGGFKLG